MPAGAAYDRPCRFPNDWLNVEPQCVSLKTVAVEETISVEGMGRMYREFEYLSR